ncbi:alpha/beta fold hydrolase [Oceanobacillus kimchii]|uniref:alpha/beta hydrolase n=1 Tax=Oceanobacillus kimchii TaxID=746691 RepID=UPI0021A79400|nr:alpha/beta fold hydrolase [Oceanobacillus kimchii]MCT1578246.1 alpha/beta fold hydrolase [Oceanobacillus kimchii]MCT2134424.1 alpha/beta fold hydrolase [Oceanobacillus kimchii]
MRTRIVIILFIILLLVACSSDRTLEEQSEEIIDNLIAGNFEDVRDNYFSQQLQETYSKEELQDYWQAMPINGNAKVELESSEQQSFHVVEGVVEQTESSIKVRMTWEQSELVGFHMEPMQKKKTLPSNVEEEKMIIGEGTDFELEGTLTLPTNRDEDLPGVILVHGSGPSDQDETVYAYAPFQDLAYGLAEQGIAVLRYPKRTFVYPNMEATFGNDLTVNEETIDDAVLAAELLKDDDRIQTDAVFVIGHSLGGMLAPRIDQQADTDGMVILAGSPRPLWEIIYDQNMYFLDKLVNEEEEKNKSIQMLEEEKRVGGALIDMTDEEAKETEVFTINGYYLKEMDEHSVGEIALHSNKPMLLLQGEADFQVTMEQDFTMWQQLLEEKIDVTFKSYPELNHFFITSEGTNKGTVDEYSIPGHVDEQVIEDIGKWIHEQTN